MAIGCCIRRTLIFNMKKGLFILTLFFNVKIYSQATGSTTTGYGILKYQLFSTSSTWICPISVPLVTAYCWGGGGSGGSAQNAGGDAGGGAGGQAARKDNISVTQTTSYTVTVGATQTGNGVVGNDSWFSTTGTVIAKGGNPGINSTGSATSGGTGSTQFAIGDYIVAGGSGASGASAGGGGGGGGGGNTGSGNDGIDNSGGSGGTGVNGGAGGAGGNGAASTGAGNTGTAPGGGGGGAKSNNGVVRAGGNGGAGRVVVEWRTTHLMFF
jgi:hypothetical protein